MDPTCSSVVARACSPGECAGGKRTMLIMRWLLVGAVAAMLAAPRAGRVQADRSAQRAGAESGVLRLGWVHPDLWVGSTLDPAMVSWGNDELINNLYSGLVRLD